MFLTAGVRYVAVGLSRDNLMGEDSVMECIADGNTIVAHSSWNTQSFDNTRQGVVSGSYFDDTKIARTDNSLTNIFDLVATKHTQSA